MKGSAGARRRPKLPPVKHPIFEGVPSIMQFAKSDEQKI